MSVLRASLAVSLAAGALVGVGVADAAGRPCRLITDRVGDAPITDTESALFPRRVPESGVVVNAPAGWPRHNVGPSSDAMDITSADVAADPARGWLTAVIRVRKLTATDLTASPTGIGWAFRFNVGSTLFWFAAVTDPGGDVRFQGQFWGPASGWAEEFPARFITGALDFRRNEVRVSVPLSRINERAPVVRGMRLWDLRAESRPWVTVPDPVNGGELWWIGIRPADSATTEAPYRVGTVNCVTPGG